MSGLSRKVDASQRMSMAVEMVSIYMSTYKDFLPHQRPSSFSIDQMMKRVNALLKVRR